MKKIFSLTILGLILSFGSYATITGSSAVCAGSGISLMDSLTTPGVWTSSNPAIATVIAGPVMSTTITGISAGVVTITCTSGSIVDTKVVTVNPVPAAITGAGTAFCTGTSISLSDATPGGMWNSDETYIATVDPATGVVTGEPYGGVTTINYILPTGCGASVNVTVNVTPMDSIITGPAAVCVGSVITLSNTTPGGVWSTASATATVGAGTGIVTGVSAGTAIITYSVTGVCGTVSANAWLSVTSGASAGTISGPSNVTVGSDISLADGVTGGIWSSSSTGIATVDASSGVVTGVAAGTTTISYEVTTCSTAYATKIVTVDALNVISGTVFFGGAAYYGTVKVWLINYNTATSMLTASDSVIVYSSGASASYEFLGKPTDAFRVKAATVDSFATYPSTGYTPTYHTSSAYWSSANVIAHVFGTVDINEDINMNYGTVTSGIGFIGGNVTTGANKGTAGGVPAVGLMVYAINQSTGATVQYTYTDASGNYSFSNLPVGTMYKIYPELINYATTPYTSVNLTTASPSQSAANFVQHTISHTITPQPLAIVNVSGASYVTTFPNPTNGKVTMEWNINTTEKATVAVMDVTGREVYNTTVDMAAGAGTAGLDLSNLNSGLYIITVKSASVNYNNEIQVQK